MFTVRYDFFDTLLFTDSIIVSDLAASSKVDCCGLLPGKQSIYTSKCVVRTACTDCLHSRRHPRNTLPLHSLGRAI